MESKWCRPNSSSFEFYGVKPTREVCMLVLVSEILAFLILLPISRYLCITPVQSVEPACEPNVQICSLLVPKKTKTWWFPKYSGLVQKWWLCPSVIYSPLYLNEPVSSFRDLFPPLKSTGWLQKEQLLGVKVCNRQYHIRCRFISESFQYRELISTLWNMGVIVQERMCTVCIDAWMHVCGRREAVERKCV